MNRKYLLAVFFISLGIRVFLFLATDRTVWESVSADGPRYLQLGRNLANHGIFSMATEAPYYRSALRTPAYPLLIACALKIMPSDEAAVRLVLLIQLVLGSLTAVLAAISGYLVFKNERLAAVVGLIVGFNPYGILEELHIMTETTFTFFLALAVVFVLGGFLSERRSMSCLIASGISFGIACLCRPVGQFIPFIIPLCWILDTKHSLGTRIVKKSLPFMVAYAVIIVPWMVRNYCVVGLFTLAENAGGTVRMVAGINTYSQTGSLDEFKPEQSRLFRYYLKEFNNLHHSNRKLFPECDTCEVDDERMTGEFCRFLTSETKPIITSNLGVCLRYSMGTLGRILFSFNKDILVKLLGLHRDEANISSGMKDLIHGRWKESIHQFGRIDSIEWVGLFWSALYGPCLVVLAAAGLYCIIREQQWILGLLFLVILVVLMLLPSLVAMNEALNRYKIPAVPSMAILAVWGIKHFMGKFPGPARKSMSPEPTQNGASG